MRYCERCGEPLKFKWNVRYCSRTCANRSKVTGERGVCAVYAIRNKFNGHVYIGASVDIQARWSSHRSLLRKGISHNQKLQEAWKLYGEECFEFVVLKTCTEDELRNEEQKWLMRGPQYNITLNANGGLPKGSMPKNLGLLHGRLCHV